jgi:hypothetical protein
MPDTLNNLYNSTVKFSTKRKLPDDNPSKTLDQIIPFAGIGSALFQISMQGITQNARHRVNILFSGLKVVKDTKPLDFNNYIPVTEKDGIYYVEKPSVKKTKCVYRCTCKDWYFTASYSSWKNKVIFGAKAKTYIRKTPLPPLGYPRKNPLLVNILCKHGIQASVLMQRNGLFKQ